MYLLEIIYKIADLILITGMGLIDTSRINTIHLDSLIDKPFTPRITHFIGSQHA